MRHAPLPLTPSSVHEHLHQQTVQFSSCIEVVDLSRVRSIDRVGAAQLRDSPENCVRAACAKSGMKREMGIKWLVTSSTQSPPHK